MAYWCHMVREIWVDIDSGNGLVTSGTNEPILLTYHNLLIKNPFKSPRSQWVKVASPRVWISLMSKDNVKTNLSQNYHIRLKFWSSHIEINISKSYESPCIICIFYCYKTSSVPTFHFFTVTFPSAWKSNQTCCTRERNERLITSNFQ